MECYVLKEKEQFALGVTEKEAVSSEMEKEIALLCQAWQVRNLKQEGPNGDDFESYTVYEPLDASSFVISDGRVVGYFADHFGESGYVSFPPTGDKISLGSYDNSNYSSGLGRIDRGFLAIVPRPDLDTNPYYDEPAFHSQEEYDDYIKWRD